MSIGSQGNLSHPGQQLFKSWIACNPRAQRKRIDKKTNQRLAFQAIAPSNRGAYENVLLLRVAVEQSFESRQQYHEQRRIMLLGQPLQPRAELFVQAAGDLSPFKGRRRLTWMIGWQR